MKCRAILNRWSSRLGGSESGQSLIELSMVGGLLVLLFLATIEFGQLIHSSIEISNAARAGVQYGAQGSYSAQDTTGIQNAAAAAAPDLSINTTSSYGCECSNGTSSTCSIGDCSSSHIEETVTVNTQVTIHPIVKMPLFPSSYTLNGQAIQKCAQLIK